MLTARDGIVDAVIRVGNGPEYELNLVHELWSAECKVQSRARVEHDKAAIGVAGTGVFEWHPKRR